MTVVNAQRISHQGLAATYGAAVSVVEINPDTDILHVKNGSGGSINATVETPGTVDGLAIADLVVAVGAGAEKFLGPFSSANYKQASNGKVKITLSATASVTVAVLAV